MRQPWAFLIVHRGKRIENRTWATKYRGELYIHAGLYRPSATDIEAVNVWLKSCKIREITPEEVKAFRYGELAAVCTLANCVSQSASRWFDGCDYGFVLKNVKEVLPMKMRGGQGIFDVAV